MCDKRFRSPERLVRHLGDAIHAHAETFANIKYLKAAVSSSLRQSNWASLVVFTALRLLPLSSPHSGFSRCPPLASSWTLSPRCREPDNRLGHRPRGPSFQRFHRRRNRHNGSHRLLPRRRESRERAFSRACGLGRRPPRTQRRRLLLSTSLRRRGRVLRRPRLLQ